MFKNRSVKLSFVKDPQSDAENVMPTFDPEQIDKIAREAVLDLTKLTVAAAGTLMILNTALKITEHHLTR